MYYFTILWDGIAEAHDSEGGIESSLSTYELMVEVIKEYLEKYKCRGAYLFCAGTKKGEDLTEKVRHQLKPGGKIEPQSTIEPRVEHNPTTL